MTLWLSLSLFISTIIVFDQTCALPVRIVDGFGNTVMLRPKRVPAAYHHQQGTMMMTGFYRPRRGNQATSVFAQGNAMSGGAYLGGQPNYLQRGPEPVDDELSTAEAEAAPTSINYNEPDYTSSEHEGARESESTHSEENEYSTVAPSFEEETVAPISNKRPQGSLPKKNKKTLRPSAEEDDYTTEDDEDDEADDGTSSPFVPFKGNRRGNIPNLNNFFPMVFSFPKSYDARGGTAHGSPPGMITAIANSYSTGKGGVASSVATAYGGSPNGKKKRSQSSNKE